MLGIKVVRRAVHKILAKPELGFEAEEFLWRAADVMRHVRKTERDLSQLDNCVEVIVEGFKSIGLDVDPGEVEWELREVGHFF